jgi:hypothetical protein
VRRTHTVELAESQAQPGKSIDFLCPAVDRRYRLVNFQIDGRRHFADYAKSLQGAFGVDDFDAKFDRWKNINYPTRGIIDEYPQKIVQIINAYSMGYEYPAVTSSCCLAERILNRLVLGCRGHFKAHPDYKKVYKKDSFDDWGQML